MSDAGIKDAGIETYSVLDLDEYWGKVGEWLSTRGRRIRVYHSRLGLEGASYSLRSLYSVLGQILGEGELSEPEKKAVVGLFYWVGLHGDENHALFVSRVAVLWARLKAAAEGDPKKAQQLQEWAKWCLAGEDAEAGEGRLGKVAQGLGVDRLTAAAWVVALSLAENRRISLEGLGEISTSGDNLFVYNLKDPNAGPRWEDIQKAMESWMDFDSHYLRADDRGLSLGLGETRKTWDWKNVVWEDMAGKGLHNPDLVEALKEKLQEKPWDTRFGVYLRIQDPNTGEEQFHRLYLYEGNDGNLHIRVEPARFFEVGGEVVSGVSQGPLNVFGEPKVGEEWRLKVIPPSVSSSIGEGKENLALAKPKDTEISPPSKPLPSYHPPFHLVATSSMRATLRTGAGQTPFPEISSSGVGFFPYFLFPIRLLNRRIKAYLLLPVGIPSNPLKHFHQLGIRLGAGLGVDLGKGWEASIGVFGLPKPIQLVSGSASAFLSKLPFSLSVRRGRDFSLTLSFFPIRFKGHEAYKNLFEKEASKLFYRLPFSKLFSLVNLSGHFQLAEDLAFEFSLSPLKGMRPTGYVWAELPAKRLFKDSIQTPSLWLMVPFGPLAGPWYSYYLGVKTLFLGLEWVLPAGSTWEKVFHYLVNLDRVVWDFAFRKLPKWIAKKLGLIKEEQRQKVG